MTLECSVSRLLFAAIFAAVSFQYVYGVNVILSAQSCTFLGAPDLEDTLTNCSLTISNGTTYFFEASSGSQQTDNVEFVKKDNFCEIRMTDCNTEESLGLYKLTSEFPKHKDTLDYVVAGQTNDFFPKEAVQLLPDESGFFRFQDIILNVKGCVIQTITEPIEEEVLYPPPSSGSEDPFFYVSYWGDEGVAECGAEVVYKPNNETHFKMVYYNQTYALASEVQITEMSDTATNTSSFWYIGKTGKLDATRDDSDYCEITNPSNETTVLKTPLTCSILRNPVTVADEGTWTIRYWLKGDILTEVLKWPVYVSIAPEDGDMDISVEESKRFDGGMDLMCDMSFGSASSCHFVRPDGLVIVPRDGLGDEKYLYNGNGLDLAECGLTIRHMSDKEDLGEWKCVMDFESHADDKATRSRMGYLHVEKQTTRASSSRELVAVSRKTELYVRNATEMVLSCGVNSPLSYCWFRRPDGYNVPFSTTEVRFSDTNLTYHYYDGLSLGECTMVVDIANDGKDEGEWTCNMGVLGRLESDLKAAIQVTIVESAIASRSQNIETTTEESTTLTCYSVPRGAPIEYCRFVRPDGVGFNVIEKTNSSIPSTLGRYELHPNGLQKGECELMISSVAEEDIGQWSCVGMLQGQPHAAAEEGMDVFTLEDTSLTVGAIVGIAIGGVVAVLIVAGIIFYIVRKKK
ncbi:uncharacterized protein [Periplaneta americana]|uniref:uncharacterized protein n=1 Tax=Periplaneta americana TaxID=6978 RepID=UPI0037E8CF6C